MEMIFETARKEMEDVEQQVEKLAEEMRALQAEMTRLRDRHHQLKQFLTLGAALYGGPSSIASLVEAHEKATDAPRKMSAAKRLVTAAEQIISTQGPKTTRELLELFELTGEEVGGSNPLVTLSVVMSRDKRFVSDRRKGWSLAAEPQDEEEDG